MEGVVIEVRQRDVPAYRKKDYAIPWIDTTHNFMHLYVYDVIIVVFFISLKKVFYTMILIFITGLELTPIELYDTQLYAGFRVWSDIDRTRNRIRIHDYIQSPLSWKFSIYFMIILNKKLLPFLTVLSHDF